MANNGGPLKQEDEGTTDEGKTDEGTSRRDRNWMPIKMNLKKIICLLLMILILTPIMRIRVFYHEDLRYIMIIWTLNQEDRKEIYEGITGCLQKSKLNAYQNHNEGRDMINTNVKDHFNNDNKDVTNHQVSWSSYTRSKKLLLRWLSKFRKQDKLKEKEHEVNVENVKFHAQENNTKYNRSLAIDERGSLTMNNEYIAPVPLKQENQKEYKDDETTKSTPLRKEDPKKRHEHIQTEVSESGGNKTHTKRKDVTNTNVKEPLNTNNEDVTSHEVRWSWYIRSKKLLLRWLSKFRNQAKLEKKDDGVTLENVKFVGQENSTKYNRSLASDGKYSLTMRWSIWKMWPSKFTNQAKLKKKEDGVNVEKLKFDAKENNTNYNRRKEDPGKLDEHIQTDVLQFDANKKHTKGNNGINADVNESFNKNNGDMTRHQASWSWSWYIRRNKLPIQWVSKSRKQDEIKKKVDGVNVENIMFNAQENYTKCNRSLTTAEKDSLTINNEYIIPTPVKQGNEKAEKCDETKKSTPLKQEDPKKRHEYIQTEVSESDGNKSSTKRKDVTNTDTEEPLNTNNKDVISHEVWWSTWYIRSKKLLLRWLSKFNIQAKLKKKEDGIAVETLKLEGLENNTKYNTRINTGLNESFNKNNKDVTRHQVSWRWYMRRNKLPIQWLSKSWKQDKIKKKEDGVNMENVMFDAQENTTEYNRRTNMDEEEPLNTNNEDVILEKNDDGVTVENVMLYDQENNTKYNRRKEDPKKLDEHIQTDISQFDANKNRTKGKYGINMDVNESFNKNNGDVTHHQVGWRWYIRRNKLPIQWPSKSRKQDKIKKKEDGVNVQNVMFDAPENNTKYKRRTNMDVKEPLKTDNEDVTSNEVSWTWYIRSKKLLLRWLPKFKIQEKLGRKEDGFTTENVKLDSEQNNTEYNRSLAIDEKYSLNMVGSMWKMWLSKFTNQAKQKKKEDGVNVENVKFDTKENKIDYTKRLASEEKDSHTVNNEYIASNPKKTNDHIQKDVSQFEGSKNRTKGKDVINTDVKESFNKNNEDVTCHQVSWSRYIRLNKLPLHWLSKSRKQNKLKKKEDGVNTENIMFDAQENNTKFNRRTDTNVKEPLNINNEDVTCHHVSWSLYKRSKKLLHSWLSKFMKQVKKEDGVNVESVKFNIQKNNTKSNRRISDKEEPLHTNSEDVTSKQTKDDYQKKKEEGVYGENEKLHKDVEECSSKGEPSAKSCGKDHREHVRGMGLGFTPAKIFGPTCCCRGSSSEEDMIRKLQSEVEELKAKLAAIDDLKAQLTLCKMS